VPTAAAPPTVARDPEEVNLLLTFVRNRDIHCPRCDYNLRNLTQPVCPECREELRLNIGVRRIRFGPLIICMAPGIFSGVAAFLISTALLIALLIGGRPAPGQGPPWPIFMMIGFGWLSVAFATALYFRRDVFLRIRIRHQLIMAGTVWLIHVCMLATIFWLMS